MESTPLKNGSCDLPAFEILYQDEHVVAINKPSGWLVHRTEEATDSRTCLDVLRDQVGRYVYAAHRLDRKTSGVLVFGLSSEAGAGLVASFANRACHKGYLALTRGWLTESTTVDRILKIRNRTRVTERESRSVIEPIETTTYPHPVGKFPTVRYSLVRVKPETGRRHQIRRHLSGLGYPIIGDTTYGDSDHNRFFREHFACWRMFLHAQSLSFPHPKTGELITISTPPDEEFIGICRKLGFEDSWSE